MPSFRTIRRVRHAPANMFDLVADVDKYPRFLPLCEALSVRRRVQDRDGRSVIVADMTVAYKVFRETFASRVTLDPEKRKILVEYLDGPFRHLENRWSFKEDGEGGCVVEFFINYAFRSRTLGLLVGSMFDAAFRKFAEAFERRADIVYGPRNPVPA
jgi:coenzyme Q-binding protein COQ10